MCLGGAAGKAYVILRRQSVTDVGDAKVADVVDASVATLATSSLDSVATSGTLSTGEHRSTFLASQRVLNVIIW
ncbi:unnamed protein product [Heligmosomoides polygyrus]|uniref:Secreted protein n=1 Tax=Heligmosomoides polygyrus TaxID=6339 RepID=A0A183GUI6_HELPZ|nr:unnamed protein product [Heligmosomoides polygyrus]